MLAMHLKKKKLKHSVDQMRQICSPRELTEGGLLWLLSYPRWSSHHEETEAKRGKTTHTRSHSSQKWSGSGDLGSLISLSKGILSMYSKESKKQSQQEGHHHQKKKRR